MKKSRYTETQIIKVLKEFEGGQLVKEVCQNITEALWSTRVSSGTVSNLNMKAYATISNSSYS